MKIFTDKPDSENINELLEFCGECAEALTMVTLKMTVLEKRIDRLEKEAG